MAGSQRMFQKRSFDTHKNEIQKTPKLSRPEYKSNMALYAEVSAVIRDLVALDKARSFVSLHKKYAALKQCFFTKTFL